MVMGTVAAVTPTSITVKTTAGTSTYTVGASTQVLVNGATGQLSAVTVGSTVLVQVPTTGSTTTATRIIVGGFPGPGGAGGQGGGVAGEQHLSGTITAVGSSSITVKSTAGTATYAVNGTTEIDVNGSTSTLSALKVGSAVTVHVYPSGSTMMAERIIVGGTDGQPGGAVPGGAAPSAAVPGTST